MQGIDCLPGLQRTQARPQQDVNRSISVDREAPAEFGDLSLDPLDSPLILDIIDNIADPMGYLRRFGLFESTARDRRRSNANTTGYKGRMGIVRHGILIHGDMGTA
jgi:hypothetical protein